MHFSVNFRFFFCHPTQRSFFSSHFFFFFFARSRALSSSSSSIDITMVSCGVDIVMRHDIVLNFNSILFKNRIPLTPEPACWCTISITTSTRSCSTSVLAFLAPSLRFACTAIPSHAARSSVLAFSSSLLQMVISVYETVMCLD